jgi:hypothetical protein
MPILESQSARIFIDDNYVGSTSTDNSQPGAAVRLDLGADKNIAYKSTYVLPRKGSRSEDKSTWFVTDKVKYHVEVVEYAMTLHSTHQEPHLVVLSEYLPHVKDEGIKVELLQPAPESMLTVSVRLCCVIYLVDVSIIVIYKPLLFNIIFFFFMCVGFCVPVGCFI